MLMARLKLLVRLSDDDRLSRPGRVAALASIDQPFDAIPSITYLVGRHSHSKMNGMGESPLGGEVKRLLPRGMAQMLHPIHWKAANVHTPSSSIAGGGGIAGVVQRCRVYVANFIFP